MELIRREHARRLSLRATSRLADLSWEDCPDGWPDPFRPSGVGEYFTWPDITQIFPWQYSGVQTKRTWVIAPDEATLRQRWKALMSSSQRADDFRETEGGREIKKTYRDVRGDKTRMGSIASLPAEAPMPGTRRYGYRSFDRQFLIADGRLIDRPRSPLWRSYGDNQVFFSSLLTGLIGAGPALTVTALVPDLHHFRGSFGGKDVIPLWRDTGSSDPNITRGVLDKLEHLYGKSVAPEELAGYTYALLAHPAYTELFGEELEHPPPRIPLTRDPSLFAEASKLGARLVWLHTYGERWARPGQSGDIPTGNAKSTAPISDQPSEYPEEYSHDETAGVLRVGGGEFAPVPPELWLFEVSGMRVLDSWLSYRTHAKPGKSASGLDHIFPRRWTPALTAELLRLLWILEETVALQPVQEDLLLRVVGGEVIREDELPRPASEEQEPPTTKDGFAEEVGQRMFPT
jgi:Type ISP C-terminal specificity domain